MKVFAEGARVTEIPLARPPSKIMDKPGVFKTPMKQHARSKVFRQLPYVSVPGYAPICMDANSPQNIEESYRQRICRDLPEPDVAILARLRLFVRRFVQDHIPKVRPLQFEEWLESTGYNESRKQQLRDCYLEDRGARPTSRQCSKIKSFVKREQYPCYKHARMINSRSDHFKAWAGPRIKAVEEIVYGALPEFIKHTPVPERPAKVCGLYKPGSRYFNTDFTAFESHFTPQVLDAIEGELIRHCLGDDGEFYMRVMCGLNKMRTSRGAGASVRGRRMSGEMSTSLGNGFTNLMLVKFIASEHHGHVDGYVEGDDGIFRTDFTLTEQDYLRLGFTIKIVEVSHPARASFCGIVCAESGQILRDPRRFLASFGWTLSFLGAGEGIMKSLLRAKALSACYETPHCPIVGVLARYALSHTRGVLPKWVDDGFHVCPHDEWEVPDFAPSSDTRLLFEEVFGVSVRDQLRVEALIRSGDLGAIQHIVVPVPDMQHYAARYIVTT